VGWGVLRVSRWGGKKLRDRLLEVRGCKSISATRNPRFGAREPSDMVTPLQPRQFFRGIWTGEGELVPHPLFRWFWRRKQFRHWSEWFSLSATIWLVKDRFEFSSGKILERKMFCELVAPDQVHVSADDMPLGADVELHETGFRFAPYYVLVAHRGRVYKLRFLDECRIDESGFLHDTVKMYLWGSHIATMRLGPISRNLPRAQPTLLHFVKQ
jgi:hypothetical protein